MPSTAGSPLWQAIFLSFAIVLILFEIIRGWRLGLMRQLVRVSAVVAAYLAAFFGSGILISTIRPLIKMPDVVLSLLSGAILALLVYCIVNGIGTILFKRTGQQSSGLVRLVYGTSGALLGICMGAFLIWLLLVGIRSIGSVADAQARTQSANQTGMKLHYPIARPSADTSPVREPSPEASLVTFLARLKNSVELGAVGEVVKKTDVIPAAAYQTLGKVGEVSANPESAERFLSFPGAQQLSEHPKIVALRNDPEIMEMITNGRFLELLQDARLIDAANDPTLGVEVKRFDFQRALDYALKRQ